MLSCLLLSSLLQQNEELQESASRVSRRDHPAVERQK